MLYFFELNTLFIKDQDQIRFNEKMLPFLLDLQSIKTSIYLVTTKDSTFENYCLEILKSYEIFPKKIFQFEGNDKADAISRWVTQLSGESYGNHVGLPKVSNIENMTAVYIDAEIISDSKLINKKIKFIHLDNAASWQETFIQYFPGLKEQASICLSENVFYSMQNKPSQSWAALLYLKNTLNDSSKKDNLLKAIQYFNYEIFPTIKMSAFLKKSIAKIFDIKKYVHCQDLDKTLFKESEDGTYEMDREVWPFSLYIQANHGVKYVVSYRDIKDTNEYAGGLEETKKVSTCLQVSKKYGVEILEKNFISVFDPLIKNYYINKFKVFEANTFAKAKESFALLPDYEQQTKNSDILRVNMETTLETGWKAYIDGVLERELNKIFSVPFQQRQISYKDYREQINPAKLLQFKIVAEENPDCELVHIDDSRDIIEYYTKDIIERAEPNSYLKKLHMIYFNPKVSWKKEYIQYFGLMGLEAEAIRNGKILPSLEKNSLKFLAVLLYVKQSENSKIPDNVIKIFNDKHASKIDSDPVRELAGTILGVKLNSTFDNLKNTARNMFDSVLSWNSPKPVKKTDKDEIKSTTENISNSNNGF